MEDKTMNLTTSVSSDSEEPNCCPICLGPMLQESYLDKCFHKFCFNCISRWTKVVTGKHHSPLSSVKCPLCKTENFSIIFGFDGSCFQRQYVNEDFEDSFILSRAHRYRLQCYYTEQGILDDIFNVSRYWKSHKHYQPNSWLQSWLKREIQALIQEEDVDIIVHHIVGVINASLTRREQNYLIKTPEKKQEEEFNMAVSEAARPFLGARTERLVYEVQLFLASGLNIEAYDAVYIQRLGWSSPGVNTQASHSEVLDRTTVIPYLYIFDEDSDANE
ncbi:E3 ubiquitin-protein ligase Topor [Senna tora]|uniref:E3 ubiquitin-protein ligase Topor n=1 Tax=Senna tora TaxID=362788 RepID=A0A834W468_9FABA|nr:E3 ubiquitin-protein ligase Topor [Senna tora]